MNDLTVVIASIDSTRSLGQCLRHLELACEGLRTEVIVVDASQGSAADRVRAICGPVRLLQRPAGTLAPLLWAAGLEQSTGRVVAFSTGHCLVSPGWAAALLRAIDEGATGAGGPLVIAQGTTPLDWAVFYLRYAGFMPHVLGAGRTERELAGDNAAYRRDALDRHAATFANGVWEVDFHRLVRADGGWLSVAPDAVAKFARSFSPGTILRQRFAHGRHSGARRVRGRIRSAWQVVLAAPLVPFILVARAATYAAGGPSSWRLAVALPWFLMLATAWAAGEAFGAWGAGRGPSPTESYQ
jgi:hypothetical protein